jgi:hypothetical protein
MSRLVFRAIATVVSGVTLALVKAVDQSASAPVTPMIVYMFSLLLRAGPFAVRADGVGRSSVCVVARSYAFQSGANGGLTHR